jgi:hypothetical protein
MYALPAFIIYLHQAICLLQMISEHAGADILLNLNFSASRILMGHII